MNESEFEKKDKNELHAEKERRWNEVVSEVENIKDKLGKSIDENIKEAVVALRVPDINTTGSCEGHERWGTVAPYVDIEAREVEGLVREGRELKKKGASEEKLKEVTAQIERKNLEERKKIMTYLEEFYRTRTSDFYQRLIIQGLARGWSRLENQGAGLQKIEAEELKRQRLLNYQKEMKDFTAFLKEKYFNQ